MKSTGVILGLWMVCSLFAVAISAAVNSECRISESQQGICVPIQQCPRLNRMYTQPRPLPTATTQLLRSLQCGLLDRTPLVCCSDTNTPVMTASTQLTDGVNSECQVTDNLRGICVAIPQCPRLYTLYMQPPPLPETTTQLIQGLQCGSLNGVPLVCCHSTARPVTNTAT